MKKNISIRTRILRMFLLMLLGIFLVLSIFLNLAINRYTDLEVGQQLQNAVERTGRIFPAIEGNVLPGMQEAPSLPDMADSAGIIAREVSHLSQVQAFVVAEDYAIQVPQEDMDQALFEETQEILKIVQEKNIPLDDRKKHFVRTEDREYVMSGTRIQRIRAFGGFPVATEMSVVFYIDYTGLNNLVKKINLALFIIILVIGAMAALMTAVMAKRIVRPIRELSEFAVALGNGDFRRREIETRERELIELKSSMNHTAGQLEKYDSEQKIFFQNVSHELRTPLMSIKGYAEGIQYNMFDDNAQPTDVILNEADRLTEMVEDLIYISKIDNIKTDAVYSECDFREILSRSGNNLKGVMLGSGVHIEYLFPPTPVLVTCDERQFEKAFGNILSNGLRFAKSKILVACLEGEEHVAVTIQDDGDGIDEESLPYIFDRFYKGKQGKHGIGLAIAKTVVEHHGGTITAENSGAGARFIIHVPKKINS